MKTANSQQLYRQSRKIYPDTAENAGQAFGRMGVAPLFFRKGKGASLYDQDYNAFTDYDLCGGALILGHAHRNIVLAVKKTAEYGMPFGVATKSHLDFAQEILQAFPHMERISFRPSARAAFKDALQLARAFTGRPLAVILDVQDVPGSFSQGGLPPADQIRGRDLQGESQALAQREIFLSCGCIEQLEAALSSLKTQLACLVVAPLLTGNCVRVMGEDDLKALRALTRKYKCLLIVNEIDSGFRFHKGGVQERLGTYGDLTCLGKIIGGGFPLGAVGGRRDILNQEAGSGDHGEAAATHPVVMRAGLATLRLLHNDMYRAMEKRAADLADGLNMFFQEEHVLIRAWRAGSLLQLQFTGAASRTLYPELFQYLLKEKTLWPPDARQPFSLCAMHRVSDCERLSFLLKKFFQKAS